MASEKTVGSSEDRFDLMGRERSMKAVVTTGNGGYDKLEYRDVPVPTLAPGEVLLQVLAAGVNNTEINTRLGWYSSTVTTSTETAADSEEKEAVAKPDGGWSEATPFPFIQGSDCCGRVVAVAPGGDENTIGSRVLVRPCIRPQGFGSMENIWMASDFDGAFAQFLKVPASEVFAVECDWDDGAGSLTQFHGSLYRPSAPACSARPGPRTPRPAAWPRSPSPERSSRMPL